MIKMSRKDLMMLVLSVSLVIGVILTSGCLGKEIGTLTQPPFRKHQPRVTENITPLDAFSLIQGKQGNPNFIIIDVRTPEEFADEHIENAINLDFLSETFRGELDKLDKNKMYLIYYQSGVSLCLCGSPGPSIGMETLNMMFTLNFRKAYNISDGLNQWKAEGLPTIK